MVAPPPPPPRSRAVACRESSLSLRLAHRLGSNTLALSPCRGPRRVAACSQAGIGYTAHCQTLATDCVAACSQAGIGYTLGLRRRAPCSVAACSQAGIGYTRSSTDAGRARCGLLTGWDRIHSSTVRSRWPAVAACSQAGIGYTRRPTAASHAVCCGLLTGWDRIHSIAACCRRLCGCGLLTGWDRIHLTSRKADVRALRLAHRLGSDTLEGNRRHALQSLRLAHRLGSDTLAPGLT